MKATQAGRGRITVKVAKNQRLLDAHGHLCPYCTRTMINGHMKLTPTKDHIRARSRRLSGRVVYSTERISIDHNRTIIVCSECNFLKSTMTLEEFIIYLNVRNNELLAAVTNNYSRMRNIRYLLDIGLDKE